MSSIANRKFTDMKQIEFQQNGSAEISAMLTQPLLENSSTYMCEVTDLQCTVGRELAFPEDQWLFSIIRRPIQANCEAYLRSEDLDAYLNAHNTGTDLPDDFALFGVYEESGGNIVWSSGEWLEDGSVEYIEEYLMQEYKVESRRYYSAMDFVFDLAQQVKQIDKKIRKDDVADVDDWDDYAEEEMTHISMVCDSGGHIKFKLSRYFMRNYMLLTSNLFQKSTGYDLFIGEYSILAPELIRTKSDYIEHNPAIDQGDIEIMTGEDATLLYESRTDDNLYVWAILTTEAQGGIITSVRDKIPIQEGLDIRKKIIVEVSLPISHTLSWNGEKEDTKYVLQEFIFPAETVSLGFDNRIDFTQSKIRFKEKALHGEMVLLNGGSNMALKKLQEGQMQAFRVSLLLEYDNWQTDKFVRTKRPLDIEQGGFFYLKLLFTKETV